MQLDCTCILHFKQIKLVFLSIQRQLKDFQSLTQEKDEQIAQLMEEGLP